MISLWPAWCATGLHQFAQSPHIAFEAAASAQSELFRAMDENLTTMNRIVAENLKALTGQTGTQDVGDNPQAAGGGNGGNKPDRKAKGRR